MPLTLFGKPLFKIFSPKRNPHQKSFSSDIEKLFEPYRDDALGGGYSISQNNAYEKHVWVYACVNAIARNCARTRIKFFKVSDDSEVKDQRIVDYFYKGNLNYFRLIEGIVNYIFSNGNSFLRLFNDVGVLGGFDLKNSDCFSPIIDNGMLKAYHYQDGVINGTFQPEQIIHFKTFNPYMLFWGLSPVKVILQTLKSNQKARKFNDKLLDNGVSIGLFFVAKGKLDTPQYDRLKQQINERASGPDHAGKPYLLDGEMDVKDLKLTQEDMAFLAQMGFSRDEIIAAFGVPPSEVGIMGAVNYSNAETQIKNFWYKIIIPVLEYIASVFNNELFAKYHPDVYCKFDVSGIQEIQEDEGKKIETAVKLTNMGFPLNAVNKKLNLGFEDVPWGDTWYKPIALVAVDEIITPPDPDTAPPVDPDAQDGKSKILALMKTLDSHTIKSADEIRKDTIWKKFDRTIRVLENQYERKVSKFFFEMRIKVLQKFGGKSFDPQKKDIIDFANEKDEIAKISEPFFEQALLIGGSGALEDLGITDIVFSVRNRYAIDYLAKKKLKITHIVDTIEQQVKERVTAGLESGGTISEIADSLKEIFNNAVNRSKTIAQTEILGAANNGRMVAFQEAGITKKEWINSRDGRVRETHQINEIIPLNERFSNGLELPHDENGPPEEVINCRCTVGGVV